MEDNSIHQKVALPSVPDRHGTPTISLALLLDFSIQNASHEITILSELLPKKKEADRKISVVQFAHSTRIIFVKLLAIVKWLRISKKFDSLSSIRYFLQQQASIFEETANRLVVLARSELKFARLPRFQVPYAIDAMTLGSFPRLPLDIKERFVARPLSVNERALTLRALNIIILHHIGNLTETIAPKCDSIVVRNGMAIVRVNGEFELCLTLLSEAEPLRWILLDIKILIECSQVALGQKLMHSLQVHRLHEIVQEKLSLGSNPLYESYVVMHAFCQSLQLQALYYQAMRLRAISPQYIRVEMYNPVTQVLVISYWLNSEQKKRGMSDYRITIYVDSYDIYSSLKTVHRPMVYRNYPAISCTDDGLCLSRLLYATILERSKEYLRRVKEIIESVSPYSVVYFSGNSVPTLVHPLVFHGTRFTDESLEVAVDSYRGVLVCQIRRLGRIDEIVELENELNGSCAATTVTRLLDRLRVLVMIERFNKAFSSLQVRSLFGQAMVDNQIASLLGKLKSLPSDRRILQFNREEHYYLIVTFVPDKMVGVVLGFYLASTNAGKCYMMQLNAAELTKLTPIPTIELLDDDEMKMDVKVGDDVKMQWFGTQKQLQAAIAAIDDRLLFLRISEELKKRGISHEPLEIEPVVGGNVLRLSSTMPAAIGNFGLDPKYCESFFANMFSCSLRLDLRVTTSWPFECTMINCPLVPEEDVVVETLDGPVNRRSKAVNKRTSCTWVLPISSQPNQPSLSESASSQILERLSIYYHVYMPVKRFALAYNAYMHQYCTVRAFTYHKLILAYGADRNFLMIMSWRPRIGKNPAQYTITFAQCENALTIRKEYKRMWNPHVTVSAAINEKFNQNCDLIGLVIYLNNTWKSLGYIYGFSRVKLHSVKAISQVLGIEATFPVEMKCNLSIIHESQIRLSYGSSNVEFYLLNDNNVAVRETSTPPTTQHGRLLPGASPAPTTNANVVNGFEIFWRNYMPNKMLIEIPNDTISRMSAHLSSEIDPSFKPPNSTPREDSPYHAPPKSFPSIQQSFHAVGGAAANMQVPSPAPSISQRMTLSVPPISSNGHESACEQSRSNDPFGSHEASTSSWFMRSSIFVTTDVLQKAMMPLDDQSSPLENYLYGLNYLSRLYSVVDASRRTAGPTNLPLRELQYTRANARNDPISVSLTTFTYILPMMNAKEPTFLRMTFFMSEACNFRLSVKLEYTGVVVPLANDIETYTMYFARYVSNVYNEMNTLSFIALCRIPDPSIFGAFAQIMRAQLSPTRDAAWVPSIQLTMCEEPREAAPMAINYRRVQCGITMNESCKRLLFVISVRNVIGLNSAQNSYETLLVGHDRRQYTFIYNVISNELTFQKGQHLTQVDESDIATIIRQVNGVASTSGAPCSIWTCVRLILEKLTFMNASYTAM